MEKGNRVRLAAFTLTFAFVYLALFVNGNAFSERYDEDSGKSYLKRINSEIQVKTTESVLASWAYESNITDENLKLQLEASAKLANFTKEIWKETIKYPWKTFKDPDVKRQFEKFSILGVAILPPEKYEEYNKILNEMQSVYGKAKICDYRNRTNCTLQLEPELTEIFSESRDPNELRYYWEQWRNSTGKPVRKMFKKYVDLSNEAARMNNFTDTSEMWLKDYESPDFKERIEELWDQVKPLYFQLHAYVRRRLREEYGKEHVSEKGPIPAHLLGNVWAQSWGNIYNFTLPYPERKTVDVSENMVKQGYTPHKMFKMAEEFFTSLGLSPMPETFWNRSILEKPTDGRDLVCHASAWDFYDGKDFRIKQCTRINVEDLNTAHHEMGHVQYFLQYKNQPLVFKEGTNPGFHEAIGDVMALSVSSPKHLRKIHLLEEKKDDEESEINQLYKMALDKVAFLPFGYLMDQWRWSVFQGKVSEKEYNCVWWQLREKYQGLSPSVVRTEDDFDAGAKYHTIANVPYIRYFVSFIIQFQFHRSLCIAAKEYDPSNPNQKPLHQCDIYENKEAGNLLRKMLELGSSKPWPDAMEILTGHRKMDASALLDYFATLKRWLEKENEKTGERVGWDSSERASICGCRRNSDLSSLDSEEIVHHRDENFFGWPDFAEETLPFYNSVPARSTNDLEMERKFRPNRLVKLSKSKKNFFPERMQIEYGDGAGGPLEMSNFQSVDRKMADEEDQKRKELLKAKAEVEDRIFERTRSKKPRIKEPFEIRSKYNDMEKLKILNAILKDMHYSRDGKQTGNGWISSGSDVFGSMDDSREDAKSAEKVNGNGDRERKMEETNRWMGEKKFRHSFQQESLSNRDFPRAKNRESELATPSDESESKQCKSECVLDSWKAKWQNPVEQTEQNELLRKSEMVKSGAEKMLRNFYGPENSSNRMKHSKRESKIENGDPESGDQFRWSRRRNYNGKFNSRSRSVGKINSDFYPLFFAERDPIRSIPIGIKNRDNKREHKGKSRKSVRKKSYKEYRVISKNPVVYNSVVISKGGRTEKSDDVRDFLVGDFPASSSRSKKNSGKDDIFSAKSGEIRENDFKNDFSNSVRRKQININNILQYLERLHLLLAIHTIPFCFG